jgi:hypothetical protein
MKTKKTKKSTLESLPKEIRDRVVVVGNGTPLSGTINHTNGNSTAFFPNGTTTLTQEQMFPNPSTFVPIGVHKEIGVKKEQEKEFKDISISVNYGENSPKIKKQLKAQGFKFNKLLMTEYEIIRIDLLSLRAIGILNKKQVLKAFTKLNTRISENVIKTTFGEDVKSELKSTITNGKKI